MECSTQQVHKLQFPEVEGREAFLPQLYAVGDVFFGVAFWLIGWC